MVKMDFQTGWKQIEPCIQKLHILLDKQFNGQELEKEDQITTTQYSNTYTIIYNMCLEKQLKNPEQLYEAYKDQIQFFVINKIYQQVKDLKGEILLNALTRKWENHLIFTKFMTRFFSYLDKSHIEHNNLPKLRYIAIKFYEKYVHKNIKDNIIKAFQDYINKDRQNELVDKEQLKKICDIFIEINRNESPHPNEIYFQLEKSLIDDATFYYQTKFKEWSDTMSCEEYLWNTNNLLEQEKNRFAQALHRFSNTHEQISSIFNDEMIKNYKPILLSKDSGFQYMLINEKTKVLYLVYNLYKKLNDTFEDIRQAFSDYCAQIGQDLINQKIDAHLKEEELEKQQQQTQQNIQKKLLSYAIDYQFVENIFKYFHDINHIINSNFYQDPIFKVSFKNALDRFLNVQIDDYGVPELLANYTDKTLRKGAKENEDEMEKKIDKIIEVFNDLNEKDIFLNLYQSQLAQRLLMEESESIQYEKVMITKIKGCCGQGTEIKNYEGMLNDINLANEYKKQFNDYIQNKHRNKESLKQYNNINICVKVLQEVNWPTYMDINLNLPQYIQDIMEEYRVFYQEKKKNQKLKWINCLCQYEIKIHHKNEDGKETKYTVNMNGVTAIILLQFEKIDEFVPVSFILNLVGIDLDTFKKYAFHLFRQKILIIQQNEDQEYVKYNNKFQSNKLKFSLPSPSSQKKFKRETVNENRDHAIEAAIVRIMKSRKQLEFSELATEVNIMMKKFKPKLIQIKKKIESLIEREYIERDSENKNILHYKS